MANPTTLLSSKGLSNNPHVVGTTQLLMGSAGRCGRSSWTVANGRWVLLSSTRDVGKRKLTLEKRRGARGCCCASAGEVAYVGKEQEVGYLVSAFGWGVRRLVEKGDEMMSVAYVQAVAFHVPVALFDDFFFQFFQAEVLSALIYRIRSSAQNRYACLVAEPIGTPDLLSTSPRRLVGVVDVTVQNDNDVLRQLEGADEYLYVSGMGVLKDYRRRKVASVLLKACDALSNEWGFDNLALRAYEDDMAARNLYANAGYKVVSRDPRWLTWIGRRRRVLMIKSKCEESIHASLIGQ